MLGALDLQAVGWAAGPNRLIWRRSFSARIRVELRVFWQDGDAPWWSKSITAEAGAPYSMTAPAVYRVYNGAADLTSEFNVAFLEYHGGHPWNLWLAGDHWRAEPIQADGIVPGKGGVVSAWNPIKRDRHIAYLGRDGSIHLLSHRNYPDGDGVWRHRNLTQSAGVI